MEKDKIRLREKLSFAFADFYGGGGQSLIAVLYLVFLTEIVKLEGTALMYTVNTGSGNGNGGIIPR